ncbi:hypothetical protein CVT26_011105, partial [Gymnopilus dilepis]
MRENRIAVLAVQETHLTEAKVASLESQFHKRMRICNSGDTAQPNSKGVALILNKKLTTWKEATTIEIVPGRALLMMLPWKGRSLVNILAIYAPNQPQENALFWQSLENKWQDENYPIPDILLGDFNMVEDSIDRLPVHGDNHQSVQNLQSFKELIAVRDGWRNCFPNERKYTFKQASTQARSRIDRIYVTTPIYNNSRQWNITTAGDIHTDHSLISMEFTTPSAPYVGKGRWSMPMHMLKNKKALTYIKDAGRKMEFELRHGMGHDDERRTDASNAQTIFANFKKETMKYVRELSKIESSKLDTEIKSLNSKLSMVLNDDTMELGEKQIAADTLEELIVQRERIKHMKIRDNIATRSRLEGETISKFWIQINKENTPRDTITMLRKDGPGPMPIYERNSKKMAELARDYHDTLQTKFLDAETTEEEVDDLLDHLSTRLLRDQKAELAKYLKKSEVERAIRDLPNGKAPGVDGIPHELWKLLTEHACADEKDKKPVFDIAYCLTRVYNDIEKYGVSKDTAFCKGWMCPLYKKGERTEISNYRPITVLNTDYKIMTRVLTTRLSVAAPRLIHQDQAGFMKGRRIEDQTELVRLMLNKCEADEENGVIVCLDQEKAYDKVRHDFIWKTLDRFNFPKHFTNTVKSLYENGETVIILNGVISSPYKITRGVRQGDPLSCLIFNLAIESLASMVRNSNLKGFKINGDIERLVVTLFADDTTIYLSEDDDYAELQSILTRWCRFSGARFNINKTVILPMGKAEYRKKVVTTRKISDTHQEIPAEIKIASDGTPVRILGVFVGNNINQVGVWNPVVEKIEHRLANWDKSHPTQDGRRLIVGMEVGGLTQYLTRVQNMPPDIEKAIARKITKFMWAGQSPTVNADTLCKPISQGGKKVLDITARNEAIELMKLKTYLDLSPTRPRWAYIADELIVRNSPSSENRIDNLLKKNIFLQSWTTKLGNKSTLPTSLQRMLKVARKHNVSLDAPKLHNTLKRSLPIWYHKGLDETKSPKNNSPWARCQRQNHLIMTVGEMVDYATVALPRRHNYRRNCACQPCKSARSQGCIHPHKCRTAALELLNCLHRKWDPRNREEWEDTSDAGENGLGEENPGIVQFKPQIPCYQNVDDELRVFVDRKDLNNGIPLGTPDGSQDGPTEPRTAVIYGIANDRQVEETKGLGGIWYAPADSHNMSYSSSTDPQSLLVIEAEGLITLLLETPSETKLHIKLTSEKLVSTLTRHLPKMEERGWINVTNKETLKTLTTLLRRRRGETLLELIARESHEAQAAKELAMGEEGGVRNDIRPPDNVLGLRASGLRLKVATQSLVYRGIMEAKLGKLEIRRAAMRNLDITRHA